MADEITVTIGLNASKANAPRVTNAAEARQYDWSGAIVASDVTSIPTTAAGTAIDLASISSSGWAIFENLDSTNYVELGVQVGGTFYPLVRLLAGEKVAFRLSSAATLYARSNTASCNLYWQVLEA